MAEKHLGIKHKRAIDQTKGTRAEGTSMVKLLSIRAKLLIAVLVLTGAVALVTVNTEPANAGVTEIRNVINRTCCALRVYIWNHEHTSGKRTLVQPGETLRFNEWVPWATNYSDIDRGHYIELGYTNRDPDPRARCGDQAWCYKYAIWQENRGGSPDPGDKIRYTNTKPAAYVTDAHAMPGASDVNGRRDLIIRDLNAPATRTSAGVELVRAP